jgi:hypothetical protein
VVSKSNSRPKRSRGAQPGNQNALKHGFYSEGFKQGELEDLEACMATGLEDEITMLRVITRRVMLLANGVENLDEAIHALNALGTASVKLAALLRVHKMLGGNEESRVYEALSEALSTVLADKKIGERMR